MFPQTEIAWEPMRSVFLLLPAATVVILST